MTRAWRRSHYALSSRVSSGCGIGNRPQDIHPLEEDYRRLMLWFSVEDLVKDFVPMS